MEDELDQIESGEQEWHSVLNDFYTPFEKTLSEASKLTASIKESLQEESDEVCEVLNLPIKSYQQTVDMMVFHQFPNSSLTIIAGADDFLGHEGGFVVAHGATV